MGQGVPKTTRGSRSRRHRKVAKMQPCLTAEDERSTKDRREVGERQPLVQGLVPPRHPHCSGDPQIHPMVLNFSFQREVQEH